MRWLRGATLGHHPPQQAWWWVPLAWVAGVVAQLQQAELWLPVVYGSFCAFSLVLIVQAALFFAVFRPR